MSMRARIEEAQRRREARSSQRICIWTAVIIALAVTGVLLRRRPLFSDSLHGAGTVAEAADLRTHSLAAANAAEQAPEPQAGPKEQQQMEASAAGGGAGDAADGEQPGKVYYYTGPDDGPQEQVRTRTELPAGCLF